jgi:hypothetical protein
MGSQPDCIHDERCRTELDIHDERYRTELDIHDERYRTKLDIWTSDIGIKRVRHTSDIGLNFLPYPTSGYFSVLVSVMFMSLQDQLENGHEHEQTRT